MKRFVIDAILKLCVEAIFFTTVIGGIIAIIGYINKWNSSVPYSNAFFAAGCLIIVAGGLSRSAAGGEWNTFQRISADSFRDMSPGERANFILNANSPVRLVILGLFSGISLIIISALFL